MDQIFLISLSLYSYKWTKSYSLSFYSYGRPCCKYSMVKTAWSTIGTERERLGSFIAIERVRLGPFIAIKRKTWFIYSYRRIVDVNVLDQPSTLQVDSTCPSQAGFTKPYCKIMSSLMQFYVNCISVLWISNL
jgi:hypothetical protein